jgi:hypothetical protein
LRRIGGFPHQIQFIENGFLVFANQFGGPQAWRIVPITIG